MADVAVIPPAVPGCGSAKSCGESAKGSRRGETPGSSSGRSSIKNDVKRWKRVHEQSTMVRLTELRSAKKVEVRASKDYARKIARKIPIELLAKDWLTDSEASVETRAYMVDKVMPTLILGVEKLLNAVDERGLAHPEAMGGYDPNFNPINFLAQYLHRNNPRYANFSESSPYVRGLRQITEELKAQLFDMEDNRLARIKAEAKRKRAERERLAMLRQLEKMRRHGELTTQFEDWNVPTDNNKVELSLLQNALRSFMEIAEHFPPEIQEVTKFGQPLESTDETGRTMSVSEFAQYLTMYVETLPPEVFEQFMVHMSKCADAHREAAERENRRIMLTNLFIYCDHSGIGLLDRHRILSLFEQFWDVYEDAKKSFRNPRRWPVVEVDEADDTLSDDEDRPKVLYSDSEETTTGSKTTATTKGKAKSQLAGKEEGEREGKAQAGEQKAAVGGAQPLKQTAQAGKGEVNKDLGGSSGQTQVEKSAADAVEESTEKQPEAPAKPNPTKQDGEKGDEEKDVEGEDKEKNDDKGDDNKAPAEAKKGDAEPADNKDEVGTTDTTSKPDPPADNKGEGDSTDATTKPGSPTNKAEVDSTDTTTKPGSPTNKVDLMAITEEEEEEGDTSGEKKGGSPADQDGKEKASSPTGKEEEKPATPPATADQQTNTAAQASTESIDFSASLGSLNDGSSTEVASKHKSEDKGEATAGSLNDAVIQMEDPETDKEKENQEEDEKEKDEGADPDFSKDENDEGKRDGSETKAGKPATATGRQSITFAEGTTFEREKTAQLLSASARPQSQMSAFDESNLNVSQFVQLTETFMGEQRPSEEGFKKLLAFLREGYEETEDEKMDRLMKARKEAISAHRRIQMDSLFEKWDNDGSGYLDMDDVEDIMSKYKEGQEKEAIQDARNELKQQSKYNDNRLNKKEFRTFMTMVTDKLPGTEGFDYFIDFLANNVERSYAERVRGEARKKWLTNITLAAQTSGVSLEPIYKAVFQALYRDAEAHGGEKRISSNIALLERNTNFPDRGEMMLHYTACTPEDAEYVLNRTLYQDMKGVSFSCVEQGKPVHVPRVNTHGNIHFWNTDRMPDEREGSFIVLPLKDRKRRVFGVLGIDTLADPHSKAIFITHEIQYFQGVAQTFSNAYHLVDMRRKLLRITESAISWIKRRSTLVTEIMVYIVEPGTGEDFVLRRMMTTDSKGFPIHMKDPPVRLERKDNLFRDYLFKAVDNSESIAADAYGNRQLAYPLRDDEGKAIAVVDISTGSLKALPTHENKEIQRMLRLLNQAHKEITREFFGEEKQQVLEAEKDDDTRMEIMFDRLMLVELRENVAKLDAKAYAELRAYNNPPEIVLHILRATLAIFYRELAEQGEFDDWANVRSYINSDLSQKIQAYDPTSAEEVLTSYSTIEQYLKDVPHGEVAKHGSLPAQHMYNWVFVCLSLLEHTRKMRQNSEENAITGGLTSE